MERLSKKAVHQRVLLKCIPLSFIRLRKAEDFDSNVQNDEGEQKENSKGKVWIYFEKISDPQNFGSLLRTAFYLV